MKIHERKMSFGGADKAALSERLIRQILDGVKTATCNLKSLCTEEELADLTTEPDWLETVVDSQGKARCNVRVTNVYETIFGAPDLRLVRGEGDGSDVEKFKRDHERYFSEILKEKDLPPLTDDAVLIVWEFELVDAGQQESITN